MIQIIKLKLSYPFTKNIRECIRISSLLSDHCTIWFSRFPKNFSQWCNSRAKYPSPPDDSVVVAHQMVAAVEKVEEEEH